MENGRTGSDDQQEGAGSADQGDEESESGTSEDDPVARSDRYTRGTVSREEWIRLLDQADPWDRRFKAQKEFERTDPPVRSVKAYRWGTDYYLLNRGEQAIQRLRYRACELDVNTRRVKRAQLCQVQGFPPESHVEVGRMDLEDQRRMAFWLALARWEGGRSFEAEAREEKHRLRVFDHSDGVPSLDMLDLLAARSEPTIVNS